MISKYDLKNFKWLNLESPQNEEILNLIEEFPFLSEVKDYLKPSEYKNIELKPKNIELKIFNISDIIFIKKENILITIHNNKNQKAMSDFTKNIELNSINNYTIENIDSLISLLLIKIMKENNDNEIHFKDITSNLQKIIWNKTQKIHRLNLYFYTTLILLIITIIIYVYKTL
jgi:hypothetical protein